MQLNRTTSTLQHRDLNENFQNETLATSLRKNVQFPRPGAFDSNSTRPETEKTQNYTRTFPKRIDSMIDTSLPLPIFINMATPSHITNIERPTRHENTKRLFESKRNSYSDIVEKSKDVNAKTHLRAIVRKFV